MSAMHGRFAALTLAALVLCGGRSLAGDRPAADKPAKEAVTFGVLESVPRIDKRKQDFAAVKGEIPSALHPPSGCHFHPA